MNMDLKFSISAFLLVSVGICCEAGAGSLIALGPVDEVDGSTVTVMGRQFPLSEDAHVSVGEYAKVEGQLTSDGSATSFEVYGSGRMYVAGADTVVVRGAVSRNENSIGHLSIAGVDVDYTPALAENDLLSVGSGEDVLIEGTQPVSGGTVVATAGGRMSGSGQRLALLAGTGFGVSREAGTGFGVSRQAGTGFGVSREAGTGFGVSRQAGTGFGVSREAGTGFGVSRQAGTGFGVSREAGTGFGSL